MMWLMAKLWRLPPVPADAALTWRLGLGHHWPTWALCTLGFMLIAATLGTGLHIARRTRAPMGALLIVLRLFVALGIAVLVLQPELQLEVVRDTKTPVVLVLDHSASMAMSSGPTSSRAGRIDALLAHQADALATLSHSHVWRTVELTGSQDTDLLQAIEAAAQGSADPAGKPSPYPPAALVLLSDGADTVHLRPGGAPMPADQRLPAAAQARLAALGVPVSTILIDDGGPSRDIRVEAISHDAYAFIKNTISIDVSVGATGYASGSLQVVLEHDGVQVGEVLLPAAHKGPQTAHFEVVPKEPGEALFTARIACRADELTCANNSQTGVVQVVRDKLRVLHVAGRPSWDERFLREALKAQANLDLISFFILRTPESDASVPETELALIPFPVERLFTTELKNFDVVIFQNFDARPFHMEAYLPNLAQAIRGGLGFMMLGGADSFAQGGYGGSALQEVLPTAVGQDTLHPGPVAMQRTALGARHSVLDLGLVGANDAEVAAAYAALPKLTDINPLGPVAPGAQILATVHPPGQAHAWPLVVVRDVKEGRTLAIATDALWHWRVAGPAQPQAARAHARIVAQALRWLAHDPATLPLQLVATKRQADVDEPQELHVRSHSGALAVGAPITVRVRETPAKSSRPLAPTVPIAPITAQADAQGQATIVLPGLPAGAYRLEATAAGAWGPLAASASVVVQPQGKESVMVAPDAEVLRAISLTTGGRFVAAADAGSLLAAPPVRAQDVRTILGASHYSLWDNAYVGALLVACAAAEWLGRRRVGLR